MSDAHGDRRRRPSHWATPPATSRPRRGRAGRRRAGTSTWTALTPVEFLPGLGFRPVLGQRAMTNFVSFAPGAEAPRHVHEEEQIVIVLDGEFTFDLDGDVRTHAQGRRRRRPVLGAARRLDHRQPLPGGRRVLPAAAEPAQAGRGAGRASRAPGSARPRPTRRRVRSRWTSDWPAAGRSSPAAPRGWARPSPPSCWPRARPWPSAPGTPTSWRRPPPSCAAGAASGTGQACRRMPCDVTDPAQVSDVHRGRDRGPGRARHPGQQRGRGPARPVRHADRRRLARRHRGEAVLPDPLHPRRPAAPAAQRRARGSSTSTPCTPATRTRPSWPRRSTARPASACPRRCRSSLGREGILVNSVNIGFVETPQWQNIHRRRAPEMPAERVLRPAREGGGAAGPVRAVRRGRRARRVPGQRPGQLHRRRVH